MKGSKTRIDVRTIRLDGPNELAKLVPGLGLGNIGFELAKLVQDKDSRDFNFSIGCGY